jgi:hypothetical protein
MKIFVSADEFFVICLLCFLAGFLTGSWVIGILNRK